jgi:hypothetical protein
MRDLKLLFLATIALTFLAGAGAGAWLGTLRAAAAPAGIPSIETRMRDWNETFPLDRSQNRRLRAILLYYDEMSERIRNDLDAERFRRLQDLRRDCREQVREILTGEQRTEYDRRLEGR